jgi:hypothetical protein
MAIRNFGPRHEAVDEALRRLSRISRAEADLISAAYASQPFGARMNARLNCQVECWRVHREKAWAAGRAYGGDSARMAAHYAERVHYADVHPGSVPWGLLREAYRDAAVGAVMADVVDPRFVDALVDPIMAALPNLHRALTGR